MVDWDFKPQSNQTKNYVNGDHNIHLFIHEFLKPMDQRPWIAYSLSNLEAMDSIPGWYMLVTNVHPDVIKADRP